MLSSVLADRALSQFISIPKGIDLGKSSLPPLPSYLEGAADAKTVQVAQEVFETSPYMQTVISFSRLTDNAFDYKGVTVLKVDKQLADEVSKLNELFDKAIISDEPAKFFSDWEVLQSCDRYQFEVFGLVFANATLPNLKELLELQTEMKQAQLDAHEEVDPFLFSYPISDAQLRMAFSTAASDPEALKLFLTTFEDRLPLIVDQLRFSSLEDAFSTASSDPELLKLFKKNALDSLSKKKLNKLFSTIEPVELREAYVAHFTQEEGYSINPDELIALMRTCASEQTQLVQFLFIFGPDGLNILDQIEPINVRSIILPQAEHPDRLNLILEAFNANIEDIITLRFAYTFFRLASFSENHKTFEFVLDLLGPEKQNLLHLIPDRLIATALNATLNNPKSLELLISNFSERLQDFPQYEIELLILNLLTNPISTKILIPTIADQLKAIPADNLSAHLKNAIIDPTRDEGFTVLAKALQSEEINRYDEVLSQDFYRDLLHGVQRRRIPRSRVPAFIEIMRVLGEGPN